MRCIEINLRFDGAFIVYWINRNMRCIEIFSFIEVVLPNGAINRNMRCIEIRIACKYRLRHVPD